VFRRGSGRQPDSHVAGKLVVVSSAVRRSPPWRKSAPPARTGTCFVGMAAVATLPDWEELRTRSPPSGSRCRNSQFNPSKSVAVERRLIAVARAPEPHSGRRTSFRSLPARLRRDHGKPVCGGSGN
jgi:hypothetical protein